MTSIHTIALKTWDRMESLMVLFLSTVLFVEMALLLFLNPELGKAMPKFAATLTVRGADVFTHYYRYVYTMVGPTVFPLLALTAVEIASVMKLVKSYRAGYWELTRIVKCYRALRIVESISYGLGFLGTVIGLQHTLHHLNPTLSQSAILEMLFMEASSAFGSTVYGISLGLMATFCREIFEGFLMPTEKSKREHVFVNSKGRKTQPMIMAGRESLPCGDC